MFSRPPSPLVRTARFARHWLRERPAVDHHEIEIDRGDRRIAASVFRPATNSARASAWIVLHGITRPGRTHPSLLRFARSLAASGTTVVVPEVPEWIELSLSPACTLPTVQAALNTIETALDVAPTRTGLIGFSFGGPQALVAASHPALEGRLAGVAGFGGYCDLERTFRYLFTGLHEWRGVTRRRRPDPYGRWIIAANFLLEVPGYENAHGVRDALLALARQVGEAQTPAWDPTHDAVKRRLASELGPDEADLFGWFAPPAALDPRSTDAEGARWAQRLADAGRRVEPLAEPLDHIGRLPAATHLLHGRGDDLIPFTETLRMSARLGERRTGRPIHTALTRLFAHSTEDRRSPVLRTMADALRFARTLSRVLDTV